MRKKRWQKRLSILVVLSILLSTLIPAPVFAGGRGAAKGKYYGQTLAAKQKVSEIETKESKTAEPLKLPAVSKAKQPYTGRFAKEQEQKDKRTADSKTFSNGKGNSTTFVFFDKIHYKDTNGAYQDIDNTLVPINDGKKTNGLLDKVLPGRSPETDETAKVYTNKANDFQVNIPAGLSKDKPLKITNANSAITFIPLEGDFTQSAVKDNAILYNNVFPGIDYRYTVLNSKVKEDIILNNYVAKTEFSLGIKAQGPGKYSPLYL